jgi:hypothetical protein
MPPTNATAPSLCIATSTCTVPHGSSHGLPAQVTVHLVVASAHAHSAGSSWLHGGVLDGTLDCSDIASSRRVWSLRPFDPQAHQLSAEGDAEVLLLLADVARAARRRSSRRLLAPCTAPVAEAMAQRGVRMTWQGSYRTQPPALEIAAVLRALSPRAAVVLGGGGGGSATAPDAAMASSGRSTRVTSFLREHGVTTRRTLVLPRGGRQRRQAAGEASALARPSVHSRDVLRFAAELVDPVHSTRWGT